MELNDAISAVLARKGSRVFSVSPGATVFEALQKMADEDIGALAVIDRGQLVGVFSERDYARKIILLGRSSMDTAVGDVMTQPVNVVKPDARVDDCMRIMTDLRIRYLLVVENHDPMGIVSIGDLVNWIISRQAETIGQLHNYIAGSYPG
jgi:CBS domain-containing protein